MLLRKLIVLVLGNLYHWKQNILLDVVKTLCSKLYERYCVTIIEQLL